MQLSSTALNLFKECPKCFWLDRNKKLQRPRGIFSSLPGGIDQIIKDRLDNFRATKTMPEELTGDERLNGFRLYAGSDFQKMRHWKTNPMKIENKNGDVLVGAFDDLLYNPALDVYAVLDYKTKGKEPALADSEKYYQSQVDIYSAFLRNGGKEVADFGLLLYFYPQSSEENLIKFKTTKHFLTPNPDAAEELFYKALECLGKDMPTPSHECEYCKFVEARNT